MLSWISDTIWGKYHTLDSKQEILRAATHFDDPRGLTNYRTFTQESLKIYSKKENGSEYFCD